MHTAQCAGRNAQIVRSVGVKKLEWKHQAFYLDLKKSKSKVNIQRKLIYQICLFVLSKMNVHLGLKRMDRKE